jgi:hypothetical protein
MNRDLLKLIRQTLNRLGVDVIRYKDEKSTLNIPIDFQKKTISIINKVSQYTYTSPERIHALSEAVRYVSKYNIPGSIVECGVWKGGSAMAAMYTLIELGIQNRDFYLYDTYEGMPKPTDCDISINGENATYLFEKNKLEGKEWVYSSLDEVKTNILSTGYDQNRIQFIQGKVEDTLIHTMPDSISILRLDTDWYESTMAEMKYLFPRLSKGGVLIIDDYGHWKGAQKAIDEYIEECSIQIHLSRIDYTGRLAIKLI